MKKVARVDKQGIVIDIHPDEVAKEQRKREAEGILKRPNITNADLARLIVILVERIEALERAIAEGRERDARSF